MRKADEISGKLLFEEIQKFPRWILIMVLLVIFSTIALTIGISLAMGYGTKSVRDEMWITLAITIPLEFIMFYLFTLTRLEKIVTSNGLYFRWTPFQKKYRVIEEDEISHYEFRKAPSSYGSSWTPGYGRLHNLSNEGFQFRLVSGKKYFFGTAERVFFQRAIEQMLVANKKIRLRES